MASSALRLRHTLRTLSNLQLSFSASFATCARPFSSPFNHAISSPSPLPSSLSPALLAQARAFKSSTVSLLSARSSYNNDLNEIGPDTILFEGCDYNHWLIVMDFPKDPKPTPEQMVETYEQTCAKGLGISVEEAKKKIYACSTTTYTGFQSLMTEEESEKFNGLPGVIFVLPDSYIDPQNKEYGGDKYINGTIIPRPPPIQYARRREPRDRSRNYDQPRNPSNNYQGFVQGDGRNYGPSQTHPQQQNYTPNQSHNFPLQQYAPHQNRGPAPTPGGAGAYQSHGGNSAPPYQGNFNQAGEGYRYPQEQRRSQQGYQAPDQGNFNRNNGPVQNRNYGQGMGYQRTEAPYGQGTNPGYGHNFSGHGGQMFTQEEQWNAQGAQRTSAPLGQTGSEHGQGQRRDHVPTPGGAGAQGENFAPPYPGNFNQAGQGNYHTQEQRGSQQGYPPPEQSNGNWNGGQGMGYQGSK
ncbi:hypothetical protein L6164_032475 [Bauhinia variegata]|uniref:Uncharacterized protein n=1 Tax=Bauhinia variegata TaxID=167791 RepID=A0ACB9KNT1_BAUVA|nr:hypothetical protein L6164_032475 [Bauhinia variegata]